jgi:uncharacterized ubiquitin-like protein YukD
MKRMHEIINNVWEVEEMWKDCDEGIICRIFNKGDMLSCANYIAQYTLHIFIKYHVTE